MSVEATLARGLTLGRNRTADVDGPAPHLFVGLVFLSEGGLTPIDHVLIGSRSSPVRISREVGAQGSGPFDDVADRVDDDVGA